MNTAFCSIQLPELFSFSESLWYLDRNFDDVSHTVEGDSVVKAIRTAKGNSVANDGEILLFRARELDKNLTIDLLIGSPTIDNATYLEEYVRRWLDLDNDITPFYDLLKSDFRLIHLADEYKGFRMVGINELFEALGWSIIGQQINLSFAYRLKHRITEAFGTNVSFEDRSYYLFPRPEKLAKADVVGLREMQFSQKKAEYLIGLAKAFASGDLSQSKIAALPDFESQQRTLTAIRGIGVWTANYALMKSLKVSQAVPYGDAGLFNALLKLGIIADRNESEKIHALFDQYKGWEHYLVFYLWRTLSQKAV